MANLESGLGYIYLDTTETSNVPERQNSATGACSTSIRTTHHMQNLLRNRCNSSQDDHLTLVRASPPEE